MSSSAETIDLTQPDKPATVRELQSQVNKLNKQIATIRRSKATKPKATKPKATKPKAAAKKVNK
jgi:hypothetical protein